MNVKGADFSFYDGAAIPYTTLDWKQYTWDFAFIKVSEGVVADPLFAKQWAAARGRTYRSAYHFFHPAVDPKLSVERTLALFNGDLGELPLAFDLEVTDGWSGPEIMVQAKSWLAWYEQDTGVRPIVYSSPNFLNNVVKAGQYPWLSYYKLWLASYPFDLMNPDTARDAIIHDILFGLRTIAFPAPPAPFKRVSFYQWTSRGKPEDVPGYYLGNGHKLAVDLDLYNGSFDDMVKEFDVSVELEPIEPPASSDEGDSMRGKVLVNLNIRSGPSTTFAVLAQLAPNDVVEATANPNGWWKLSKITRGTQNIPLPAVECYAYEGDNVGYIQTLSTAPDPAPVIPAEVFLGWTMPDGTEVRRDYVLKA